MPLTPPPATASTCAAEDPSASASLPISQRLRARISELGAKIVVLTGAGISVAADLPTYRGAGGLYPTGTMIPLTRDLATSRKVHTLWSTIAPLTAAAADATPTPAHQALAEAETSGAQVTVITQNVDGLHAAAASTVLELHGNLARATCLNPKCTLTRPSPAGHDPATSAEVARCTDLEVPDPANPGFTVTAQGCGARLRPDLVLFGELLPAAAVTASIKAAHQADVVLAVGTSLQVHPAAGFVLSALASGADGAWLELDPTSMLDQVDPTDRDGARLLEPVPGDCQITLPLLLSLAHHPDPS